MSSPQPDQEMMDAEPTAVDSAAAVESQWLEELRIRILPGATDTAVSFQIDNEDHTLGNALRYMIMKNPEVELCGYTIPHPAEAKMNIRIQTFGDYLAIDALEKGLDDLSSLCDVVTEKFTVARDEFNALKMQD
ncbi:MAG: RNA polymerase subunit AC19 [Cirrosporium novae-zelandiae]|nr:MAG: RNA polymerase subunit AC19 [Cirrosporium novae-zelandiae]